MLILRHETCSSASVDLLNERQVPRELPVALTTREWGGVPYYETSARKNINVEGVFEDVLRQIIRAKTRTEEIKRREKERRKKKCVIL